MLSPREFTLLFIVVEVALILPLVRCRTAQRLSRHESTIFLRCQGDRHFDKGINSSLLSYQWILPSGDIIPTDKQSQTNTSKHTLLQNGDILQIQNIDKTDSGIYVCLIFSTDHTNNNNNNSSSSKIVYTSKHILNKEMWSGEKADYIENIQYGFMAGFVVLVVMTLVCYNYYSHQEEYDIGDKPCAAGVVVSAESREATPNGQEQGLILVTREEMCRHNQAFLKEESSLEKVDADIRL